MINQRSKNIQPTYHNMNLNPLECKDFWIVTQQT